MDIFESMTPEQLRVTNRLMVDNVRAAVRAIEEGRRGDALKILKTIPPKEQPCNG